jgi:hypothetical protein
MTKWGYKRDYQDHRDYDIRDLLQAVGRIKLPDAFDPDPDPWVGDQGETPQCVGYAHAGMKTIQEYQERGKKFIMDAAWIYARCKERDEDPGDGTYPRVAMNVLHDLGCRRVFSLDNLNFIASRYDKDYKIHSYWRIKPGITETQVKTANYAYGSFTVGINFPVNWIIIPKSGILPPPGRMIAGGHDMLVKSWGKKYFCGVNSWGRSWGDNGKYYATWDILRWMIRQGDAWKALDVKEV